MTDSSSFYGKRFRIILQEDNYELMTQSMGGTFRDFMNSLVGKTRQQIFDAGLFASLKSGNKYGMTNAAFDIKNPEVLISKFIQKLGNYLNKEASQIRSGISNTEEFKKKYDYDGEHKANERKRFELGKKAIGLPDGPEKDAARKEFYAFRNDSKYTLARHAVTKKEDKMMEDFHNAPLKPEDVQNDNTGDYTQLGLMFQKIMRMRKGITENINTKVRKNKQGLMGSKTQVHKDKKKESSKKEGRKKVKEEDDNTVGGGALGPAAAAGNTQGDFYAKGDFRVPKMLGSVIQKRTPPELVATKISGKKKRRKSKKKK